MIPNKRLSPHVLLERSARLFEDELAQRYALVWLELTVLVGREPDVYGAAARLLRDRWAEWLDARLALPSAEERAPVVEALSTICDGLLAQGIVAGPLPVARALKLLVAWSADPHNDLARSTGRT